MWIKYSFVAGLVIGAIIVIFKDLTILNKCSSWKEFLENQSVLVKDRIKRRKAYWDAPMNRRDWFWWGRR